MILHLVITKIYTNGAHRNVGAFFVYIDIVSTELVLFTKRFDVQDVDSWFEINIAEKYRNYTVNLYKVQFRLVGDDSFDAYTEIL